MREEERERRETRREQQRSETASERRKHEDERDNEIHLSSFRSSTSYLVFCIYTNLPIHGHTSICVFTENAFWEGGEGGRKVGGGC